MFYEIILGEWTKADDGNLFTNTNDLVLKTKGKPAYANVQDHVLEVETENDRFGVAISNARDGSKSAKLTLKKVRTELLFKLKILFKAMELNVTEPESYYLTAGLKVRAKPVRERTPLEKPDLDYFVRDVLSGTARGKVKILPKGVTQLAVEYSYDGGATWHNGTYSAGKIFLLANLTPKTTVTVRVKFLGTFRRQSDWSGTMEVFVL